MKTSTRRIIFTLLHGIGFLLLYFVIKNLDWHSFFKLFKSFPVYKFVLGLLILLVVYILKTIRWFLINRSFGIRVSFINTLVYYLVSGFLSVITPGRIGELAKVFFIRRKNQISYSQAVSSVILDRVWDVLVLSLMAGFSLIFLLSNFSINVFGIVLMALFIALSILVLFFPGLMFRPLLFLSRRYNKIHGEIQNIYGLWTQKRIGYFIPSFLLSIIAFLLLSLIPLIFSPIINAEVPFSASISAVSISNILSFLPVSIAGFGTREYVFIQIWQIFEHSKEAALTISTTQFICTYLGSLLLGGLVYLAWFRKLFNWSELKKQN